MSRPLRRARGFALVMAVFLIVSLAAVGAYLLTLSNVQVETGIMDEQGARAYQASRAGLEWGAYRVLRNGSCVTGPTAITFSTVELAGFRAEVACTAYLPETEGATPVNVFRITATGCNAGACTGGGATYVERQLQLTVTN